MGAAWLAMWLGVALVAGCAPSPAAGTGHDPDRAGAWTGRWLPAMPLDPARSSGMTATALADGRVLVVGGLEPGSLAKGALPGAWLLAPTMGSWAPAASLSHARQYHTATRLADGRVAVVGGYLDGSFVATAEIFDPSTGRWSLTAPQLEGRIGHTATLLRDGRVLVAGGLTVAPGGHQPTPVEGAEMLNPATGTWAPAGVMPQPVWEHTATLLADGTVLVAGGRIGQQGASVRVAQIFDPSTATWSSAPHLMRERRSEQTATLLGDGNVLVAGGSTAQDHGGGGAPTAAAELFDPASRSWRPAAALGQARLAHSATLLGDGRVLVVGGVERRVPGYGTVQPLGSAEVYDPMAHRWTPTGPLLGVPDSHSDRDMRVWMLSAHHAAERLGGPGCGARCGKVLVLGGDDPARSAQFFDAMAYGH